MELRSDRLPRYLAEILDGLERFAWVVDEGEVPKFDLRLFRKTIPPHDGYPLRLSRRNERVEDGRWPKPNEQHGLGQTPGGSAAPHQFCKFLCFVARKSASRDARILAGDGAAHESFFVGPQHLPAQLSRGSDRRRRRLIQ